MAIFNDLLAETRKALNTVFEKNKDSSVVEFINKAVNKLNIIIKTIDEILKKKNIDIKKMSIEARDKGKEYLDKGKKYLESDKVKNIISKTKETGINLASKLTSIFKKENNTGVSPPTEESKESIVSKVTEKLNKAKNKFLTAFSRTEEKQNKRKKEIEEEKKAVAERSKKKENKKSNWLESILSKIGSLGIFIAGAFKTGIGFLLKGIKKFAFPVLKKAAGWLGGFLFKGFTKLIPSFSTTLAKTLQSTIGGLLKGGLSLGKSAVGTLARGALAVGRGLLPTVARAALGVATGPIGWIALAATAIYGGYKLYKYLNRGKIKDDIYGKFLKLRLLTYGIDDSKKEYYSKIFDLEMLMKNYIVFKDYQVTFKPMSDDDKEKILDLFNINKENKEEYSLLSNWLKNRFYPAFQAHVKALYNVNNSVYFDELNKLKEYDLFRIISSLVIPSRIYQFNKIPTLPNTVITVTKEEIDNLIFDIVKELKEKIKNVDLNTIKISNETVKSTLEKINQLESVKNNAEIKAQINAVNLKDYNITLGNIDKFIVNIFNIDNNDIESEQILKKLSNPILNKIIKFRYMLYGFEETRKDNYPKLAKLESLILNYIVFKENSVTIKQLNSSAKIRIFDIFSVSRENDSKFQILNNWFNNRFLPVFIEFVKALYSISRYISINNLDKLNVKNLYELLTKFIIPREIYNVKQIPVFPDSNIIVTETDIDNYRTNLINEFNRYSEKEKINNKAEKTQPNKTNTANNENKKPDDTNPFFSRNKNQNKDKTPDIISEDPVKPKEQNIGNNKDIETKVNSKLNIATGKLEPGDMSLTGIVTRLPKERIYNLDPNVRELFTGMAKEYNSLTGKSIPVTEAFRSYEDQMNLYKKYPGKAAKPGNSTHEYGLAIDIDSKVADELDKLGLLRKYGFTRPIGGEKWHIEPIGVSIDPTRAKNDENFRLTSVLSSPGKGGDGYGSLDKSTLKKRNIPYQIEIYNRSSDNPINIDEALNRNKNTIEPTTNYNVTSIQKSDSEIEKITNKVESKINSNNEKVPESPKSIVTESKPILQSNSNIATNSLTSNIDLAKYANLSPEEAIRQASRMVGIDENTMLTFAKMESSLKADARAKTSTASGLFQITDPTWKQLVNKYGSKYGIDINSDKNNPFYNSLMAAEYAKENISKLPEYKSVGIQDDTAMYLAHHFGLNGATKIINALKNNPNTPIQDVISKSAYKANKTSLANNTVSSYIQKVAYKLQSAENTNINAYRSKSTTLSHSTIEPPIEKQNRTIASTGYTKTVYSTKPDISSSLSGFNISSKPIETKNINTEFYKNLTSGIESILNEQLNSLGQIVTILTSIDNKFNIEKLQNTIINGANIKYASNKNISSNSINLSKEKINI